MNATLCLAFCPRSFYCCCFPHLGAISFTYTSRYLAATLDYCRKCPHNWTREASLVVYAYNVTKTMTSHNFCLRNWCWNAASCLPTFTDNTTETFLPLPHSLLQSRWHPLASSSTTKQRISPRARASSRHEPQGLRTGPFCLGSSLAYRCICPTAQTEQCSNLLPLFKKNSFVLLVYTVGGKASIYS